MYSVKKEEEEICVPLSCQSTFKISRVLLFTFSSYSIRSHKILFTSSSLVKKLCPVNLAIGNPGISFLT